jgi:hypothetical protein
MMTLANASSVRRPLASAHFAGSSAVENTNLTELASVSLIEKYTNDLVETHLRTPSHKVQTLALCCYGFFERERTLVAKTGRAVGSAGGLAVLIRLHYDHSCHPGIEPVGDGRRQSAVRNDVSGDSDVVRESVTARPAMEWASAIHRYNSCIAEPISHESKASSKTFA